MSGASFDEDVVRGTLVAIQWHISDHLGSSREGASGSVRIRVYDFTEVAAPDECNSSAGVTCTSAGLIVFPRETLSCLDGYDT